MLTELSRLAGAALVASVVACGGAPADYEGADNTDKVREEGACDALRNCCLALTEDAQGVCLGGASSGQDADCAISLRQQRESGGCR